MTKEAMTKAASMSNTWYRLEMEGAHVRVDSFAVPPATGQAITIDRGNAREIYTIATISHEISTIGRSAIRDTCEIQHARTVVTVLRLVRA